jgi:hypothetical protein
MSAAAASAAQVGGQQAPQGQPQAAIPFEVGSNLYREVPFATQTFTPGASAQAFVFQITPGNFLNGVVLQVTSSGGTLGTGVISAPSTNPGGNGALDLFTGVTLEDTGGAPILYPMGSFEYTICQKYLRPWSNDPQTRPGFSNTINPAFTIRLSVAVRNTLGSLANTDARAQYRVRLTAQPLVATTSSPGLLQSQGTATAPTVTAALYLDAWAQPDQVDLMGNPIAQEPDGLLCSRFVMNERPVFNVGNNILRFTLTGNEIRGLVLIVRNSLNQRIDLTDTNAGTIRFRLDNRVLWNMRPSQIIEEMFDFYTEFLGNSFTRETGVYVIPRFRNPGSEWGEYWLQTVEQSLLQIELAGGDLGANTPGSIQLVYDQLAIAPGTMLAPELEGI